jgi:Protein of unknown function (DUF2691)
MMTPLGLKFNIPNEWGMHLHQISKSILAIPSTWIRGKFEEIPCLDDEGEMQDLFDNQPENLDNFKLRELISSKNYYTIFSTLFGYFNTVENHPDIKNLKDFIDSDVDVVICIYDSVEVLVFAKDSTILKQIEENCRSANFENIEYRYADAEVFFE